MLEGSDPDLHGQELRLTFLHTSDIHSRLVPYDFAPLKTDTDLGLIPEAGPFGGATRMAALLKRERDRADRLLHLDSGDCFQGAPIFNLNNGEAEFRFLSEARLDAAVIGNHEFDAGAVNFTEKARDFANFPLLAANYIWDDHRVPESNKTGLYTAPYSIHNVKGVRVGVIGMANISSLNSIVEGGNSLQATPLEQNEAARAYVEMLRPTVDLIVIVSHLGLTEDQDLIRGYDGYYEYGTIKSFIDRDAELATKEGWQDQEPRVAHPGVVRAGRRSEVGGARVDSRRLRDRRGAGRPPARGAQPAADPDRSVGPQGGARALGRLRQVRRPARRGGEDAGRRTSSARARRSSATTTACSRSTRCGATTACATSTRAPSGTPASSRVARTWSPRSSAAGVSRTPAPSS